MRIGLILTSLIFVFFERFGPWYFLKNIRGSRALKSRFFDFDPKNFCSRERGRFRIIIIIFKNSFVGRANLDVIFGYHHIHKHLFTDLTCLLINQLCEDHFSLWRFKHTYLKFLPTQDEKLLALHVDGEMKFLFGL